VNDALELPPKILERLLVHSKITSSNFRDPQGVPWLC
jgi:hypothetical protein